MKKFTIPIMVTALMGFAMQTQALPINGSILFGGKVTLDTASAGTATQVTGWSGLASGSPQVEGTSGDFASVADGSAVTFTAPWSFNSGPVSAFWTVGGFTFDLVASSITSQVLSPGSVAVAGTGWISGNDFDPTLGSWSFTTQDPSSGSKFSFSASSNVPDGGATAILLGIGFLGLAGLRRKLA